MRRGRGAGRLLRSSAPLLLCLLLADRAIGQPGAQAEAAAREAATSAVRVPSEAFLSALDTDALLAQKVGAEAWRGLTEKQRAALTSAVRQRIAAMLAPSKAAPTEIAWAEAVSPGGGAGDVIVGIGVAERTLKTRWRMRFDGARWRVEDVTLSDPGISLTKAALSTIGTQPVRRKPRAEAVARLLPWIGLLAAIGLATAVSAPRVPLARRRILYLAAGLSAAVVATGGAVAAWRIAAEPYALRIAPAAEPWRELQDRAVAAQREGRADEARDLLARAAALGSPPGPAAFEMGLAARQGGDAGAARGFFERALAAPEPAPGAARELATLDLEIGDLASAERRISAYLAAAGPDPDALSLQAVIESNLGKAAESVASIARARRLVGGGPKGAELEAKIRARSADAAGTVASLRPLEEHGALDREALRSDPAYLQIATDPVWVRFLNEKSPVESPQSTGKTR